MTQTGYDTLLSEGHSGSPLQLSRAENVKNWLLDFSTYQTSECMCQMIWFPQERKIRTEISFVSHLFFLDSNQMRFTP